MQIPFIVVALAFSIASTATIILLVERHIVRPAAAPAPDLETRVEARREIAA